MSILQKYQVVLTVLGTEGTTDIQFAQTEDPELGTGVFLMRSTWRDMGEPDTITVTVVPGDKLNG